MDYKEKYERALERAKELCDVADMFTITIHDIYTIFPELKESDDERIRKELIELISCMHDADPRKKGWIAWLEKQGKRLGADEVTKPQWISVENELPPRGRTDPNVSVPVITCKIVNRELHEIGFQQYIFGNGKWKYCDATHWMSLPQPPTVAKNATVQEKGGEG